MTRFFHNFLHIFLLPTVLLCLFSGNLFAENVSDEEFGFSLDLPEGYNLADYTEDGMSLLFTHPNIPVTLALKLYLQDENTNTSEVLNLALSKLKAASQIDTFDWNNSTSSISSFSMKLDQNYSGWALCSETDPKYIKNAYIVLICYCPTDKFDVCSQFIISTINSLCVDMDKYNKPGPVVSYAFPKEGTKPITLNIAGNKIQTTLDKSDEEAAKFVVDLEYSVLTLYGTHNLWKEAWQRYYRIIYRDNYGRIENVINDVYAKLWPYSSKKKPENPTIEYAQNLLSWVQNFSYARADTAAKSDFTSLPEALSGKGNDCDSRSLMICAFLKTIGIESLLLIGPEYSHAMVVSEIEAPGQIYELEGTDRYFLFGETTAKVTWGMIPQDYSDRSKWIPVILP